MARFLPPEAFSAPSESLSLLPFNFERTGVNQFLVSNMVGDFVSLSQDEINRLVDLQLRPGDGLYERAYAAHLITGGTRKLSGSYWPCGSEAECRSYDTSRVYISSS